MLFITILCIVLAVVIGLVGVFTTRYPKGFDPLHIDYKEFVVVASVMAVVIAPLITFVGNKLSVDDIVTYQQWVSGVELQPIDTVETCYEGHSGESTSAGWSNCENAYPSSEYYWTEYWTEKTCTTDSEGEEHCTKVQHSRRMSAWIYTPYATQEHRYSVTFNYGGIKELKGAHHNYKGVWLDQNPVPFPTSTKSIPAKYLRGAPDDWLDAKRHFDAGDPRSVTAMIPYKNYILASKDPVLSAYSSRVDSYLEKGLLPDHTANILDDPMTGPIKTQSSKISFVGVTPNNVPEWENALMRFNTALGMTLQGDLHVVVVDSSIISKNDSIGYLGAVKAYWTGDHFGKRALGKNGIIVVLGTDGSTITWARATTGMPFGNTDMVGAIERFPDNGVQFTPQAVFGTMVTNVTINAEGDGEATVSSIGPKGALQQIIFEKAPFARASMTCDGEDCVGYKNLVNKIDPTVGQKAWMVVISTLIALVLWYLVATTDTVGDAIESAVCALTGREPKAKDWAAKYNYRDGNGRLHTYQDMLDEMAREAEDSYRRRY